MVFYGVGVYHLNFGLLNCSSVHWLHHVRVVVISSSICELQRMFDLFAVVIFLYSLSSLANWYDLVLLITQMDSIVVKVSEVEVTVKAGGK